MKKIIIISLVSIAFCFLIQETALGQVSLTSSGRAQSCGNATGQLFVTPFQCVNCVITRWEEGTLSPAGPNPRVFTITAQYPSSVTFQYNVKAPGVKAYRAFYVITGFPATEYATLPIEITADLKPTVGTLSASVINTREIAAVGQLSLTNSFGTVHWNKIVSPNVYSELGTNNYSVTGTTEFRAIVTNGGCDGSGTGSEDARSNIVKVEVFKQGILTGPSIATDGDKVNLSLTSIYKSIVRWEYSIDGGTTWTNFDYNSYGISVTNDRFADTHEITANTKFRVLVDLGSHGTGYTNTIDVTYTPYTQIYSNPTNGGNYIREQKVTTTGITDPNVVSGLTSAQKHEIITYQDGKGRPVQTNIRKGSYLEYDIISTGFYDRQGRQATQYLPYVSALNNGAYKSGSLTEQASFYANGTNDKVADSPYPFATTIFEKSPLGKVTEQGSVGQQWQPGNGHSNLITYSNNVANEVWLFNSINGAATFYGVNELSKLETTDADQKKNQKFVDKAGRTILTRVQLDEKVNGSGVATPWLETYYIYNDLGGIKYMLPPKGVDALKSAFWILSQAIVDQYAYQFIYDARGRLIEKKVPGQAWMYFCYDRLDRMVLMKDANTGTNKWIYLKYDRRGRPVMQGLYTNTTYSTRATLQLNVVDPLYSLDTDLFYEERGSVAHGYTNQIFPTTNTQVLTVNYYDNYDFDNSGTDDWAYVNQGLAGENAPLINVMGLPTGSKRLVMDGGSTWLVNYAFYDANGHTIQMRSNNQLNPTVIDNLATAVYDFEGKVALTKNYHNAGSGRITTVINKFNYDNMGRVIKIYQNNNAAPTDQLVVQYDYNELGQLVDKKLHGNTAGTTFLQSIDMRYGIQGWLTSINNAQLTNDGVMNDSDAGATLDYFGMELLYEKTETGLTSASEVLYNGNISAVKWKGVGETTGVDNQRSYKNTYDKANRLRSATSQLNTGTVWIKETNALNESTSTVAGVSGYDFDGNIIKLQRNQRKHQLVGTTASYISEVVDDLTYVYNNTSGTPLSKVTDATAKAAGFDNGTSSTNTDYVYETNGSGNLYSDLNKGISSITYNHLGKATQINFTDTRKIEYLYDAGGTKLTMKTYKVGPVLQATTDYINGFVYQEGVLSFFGSPEGRVVNNAGTLEYQYSIADNQGNTRIVFSSVNPTKPATIATFEDAVADAQVFKNVSTSTTYWVSKSAANNTSPGQYVMRMNNTYNPSGTAAGIGPAKSLNVFPGDVVDMEVYAYYEGSTGFGGTNQGISTLMASVASVLTTGVSLGEVTSITNGVNSAYGIFGAPGNQGDTKPSAYLNYILLDKDYKLLDMGWQPVPSTANMAKQKVSFTPRSIKEAGYLYVYLSYEGQGTNWVYFDDLKITHTKTNVIQYNDYYPFGLQASTSWTRDQTTGNNYLYDEANELNPATGWYETFFRNYDPTIGRFTSIDPLAAKYASQSSYHYAFNNPIMFNDPIGAEGETSGQVLPEFMFGPPSDWGASSREINNPGFNPKMWEFIQTQWTNTWDATGGNGSSKWSSSGGTQYYNQYGQEVSGVGSSYSGYTPSHLHQGNYKWKTKNGNNVSFNKYRSGQTNGEGSAPRNRIWYTGVHSSDLDIVTEHQTENTKFGYTETIRVVTIAYGKGQRHKISKYGYQVKDYIEYGTTEEAENSPYITTFPGETFKISDKFRDEIHKAVNNHLHQDYYTDWIYLPRPRLNVGAPHDGRSGGGSRYWGGKWHDYQHR